MNKTEAQQRVDAAIKELEAAKAALEQAQESDGRVIMKPSEVPVGEYFKFVDERYSEGETMLRLDAKRHVSPSGVINVYTTKAHDDKPVYLTDPYGNAIEPCEKLPYDFDVGHTIAALCGDLGKVWSAFSFSETVDGYKYWRKFGVSHPFTPSAAAKLRGMIHKWNQENGGQG